jgi:aryl-alcohol dehydrogenase-like predicted oxidoreductase
MQYRSLGKSDLKVSEVSFGCMSLESDAAQNKVLIQQAIEQGINLFDTADLYEKGENESRIGNLLKPWRNRVLIATKVGNQLRTDGGGWDWNPSKAWILRSVEGSLRRLQTEYIDLYQLHGGTLEDNIDETIEAFEILQQQGKIRYYGISSIRPNVIKEYIKRSRIVSVMMQYSLLDRRPEEACLPLLHENGIGVLARGSLAKGLLAGKQPEAYLDYTLQQVQQAAQAIAQASLPARTAAQTAVAYTLAHPAVSSAVAGIRTPGQLNRLLEPSAAGPLFAAELNSLQQAIPANYYQQHR